MFIKEAIKIKQPKYKIYNYFYKNMCKNTNSLTNDKTLKSEKQNEAAVS